MRLAVTKGVKLAASPQTIRIPPKKVYYHVTILGRAIQSTRAAYVRARLTSCGHT